ncbi:hypothetical protein GCM10009798_43430 [Nocardioides panacihumi]|uniref:Uncharacterized protein n=1 Tax=Nocardioides panacihumi TaxID=400774 RepID=A0ABN2RZ38_9ACTN
MSLTDDRQVIAAAASTVTGIDCEPSYQQSLTPGDGFVRLAVSNRADNGFGFVNTWQVWIALSQDVATAEEWMDDHLSEVIDALDPVLLITSATPSELILAGGASINGLIVEGARAAG